MNPRVVIGHRQRVVLDGVAALFQQRAVTVVGTAEAGYQAVFLAREHTPDLVLLDLELTGMESWTATKLITRQQPDTRVLIFSASEDQGRIAKAMEAGASGYVRRQITADKLTEIIWTLRSGQPFSSPYFITRAVAMAQAGTSPAWRPPELPGDLLSEQESRVLLFVVEGLDNQEIAERIHVSRDTVKAHLKQLYKKLNAKNRTQAAVIALKKALVLW